MSIPARTCSLLGCGRPHEAKGYCKLHYYRMKRGISPDLPVGFRYGPRPQPIDWARCGTASQYRAHLRKGETPCEPCRKAERRRVNLRYERIGRPVRDRRVA